MSHNQYLKESFERMGMEVSVLERQQARFTWLLLQQQNNCDDFQNNPTQLLPVHEVGSRNDAENFGNVMVSSGMKQFLSWNVEEKEDIALVQNMESIDSKDNFRKRKAETMIAEETTGKLIKRDPEEEESKVTEKGSRDTSAGTSKGNSKLAEVKKPDYIHVRARRGQATDSHSLAERARREKISKKMMYLQGIVPGCNKSMGKAGMLDEIINYVQSLQRQVEFLSMKLAAVSPRVSKFGDFFEEEFPASMANFQATTSSQAMASSIFYQLNSGQQGALDISSLTNSTQEASEQVLSSSTSFPELYLDPTRVQQNQQLPICDTDFPRLFGLGFL